MSRFSSTDRNSYAEFKRDDVELECRVNGIALHIFPSNNIPSIDCNFPRVTCFVDTHAKNCLHSAKTKAVRDTDKNICICPCTKRKIVVYCVRK